MKLESRLGDFFRSLFKVTGIPQATTDDPILIRISEKPAAPINKRVFPSD
jgi:hypothetical protein